MSFSEFNQFYQERRQFFEEYEFQNLLRKTYIKLRKGSEIRIQDVSPYKESTSSILSEILIDVPQIKLVKERMYQSLETVQDTSETDVCIIYGDYGHGKSQTAHILMEELQTSPDSKRLVHLENISTFRSFFQNFGNHLANYPKSGNTTYPQKISEIANIFQKARNIEELSVSQLIQTFVEYLQLMASDGYNHIVILDEMDKIVNDEIERKNWVDFFVTLNDEPSLSLLLVCLIPQRMATQLINVDRRLERWNHFFNINATVLDGKYSTEVIRAIATILALHDCYHRTNPSSRSLQFVYNIVKYKIDYLETTSIRSVNTWVLILGELILQFEKYHIWDKYSTFKSLEIQKRIKRLRSKMQILLELDNLPQFELRRDDSDDTDSYRIEYVSEPLRVGKHVSAGQFLLYTISMNAERLVHQVAVLIEYPEKSSEVQSGKATEFLYRYPTLRLIAGLQDFNSQEEASSPQPRTQITKYPSASITIPQNLIAPLLLIPKDERHPGFNQIKQLVINWSNVITGHRDELHFFLRELPTEMIRREILLRSLQLAKMTPDDITSKPDPHTSPTTGKIKARVFLAANIVSTIEEIKTFKYLATVEKNVSSTLMAQFPGEALETIQEFEDMIALLEEKILIEKGGKKRITIKQTSNWDQMKAIELLKSEFS